MLEWITHMPKFPIIQNADLSQNGHQEFINQVINALLAAGKHQEAVAYSPPGDHAVTIESSNNVTMPPPCRDTLLQASAH